MAWRGVCKYEASKTIQKKKNDKAKLYEANIESQTRL